jgi:hypothetical protein
MDVRLTGLNHGVQVALPERIADLFDSLLLLGWISKGVPGNGHQILTGVKSVDDLNGIWKV